MPCRLVQLQVESGVYINDSNVIRCLVDWYNYKLRVEYTLMIPMLFDALSTGTITSWRVEYTLMISNVIRCLVDWYNYNWRVQYTLMIPMLFDALSTGTITSWRVQYTLMVPMLFDALSTGTITS